ncbi:potassium transporter Kup [Sphingomonas montanisoli]|uniref:Probable potassium transport system protein Kup n=1 Tax=Sphingomonas montanisoli TaxID=2606412 RepID=A0A5D9CA11_9SPHN|nr:potassium transporter Kup [Sphingomonas montanisoli]TZG28127.1 potassium transporter Kup [Sphingomonas montanisoli]
MEADALVRAADVDPTHGGHSQLALTLGALGVVFGDIGTSPLYAFREALNQAAADGIVAGEILGVLSLALWALILVVTCKYVLFLMRADNNGEGGVLALMALAQRSARKRGRLLVVLGAAGAALFYGDGIITPALSVLSAVEGLKTIPAIGHHINRGEIILITAVLLVALFSMQGRGTAAVARLFGPVCLLWFAAIAAIGLIHIFDEPAILAAFSPHYAVLFMLNHGVVGLFVLGAVFLTVTGAEALTADMGHFGARPIRRGWFIVVFPALALNYLGQGAFALSQLEHAAVTGAQFTNQNWFFMMIPEGLRAPMVLLATMATVIASQAVITGAFSLTQQAIQLGLLPRMKLRQTSAHMAGQVFLPGINRLLFVGVMILVFGFGSSSAMAAAYGISVTGTMVVTTLLAFVIVRRNWQWRLGLAVAVIAPFLLLDLFFFGANILRVYEGGWVPLVVAGGVGLLIVTWVRGRKLLHAIDKAQAIALEELARMLTARPPERVAGTAIFLSADRDGAPNALLHNLKHNKILHERNIALTVRTAPTPFVDPAERLTILPIDANFSRALLTYGFMEAPDVPRDLAVARSRDEKAIEPVGTSYFIGRSTLRPSKHSGMPFWQDLLFIFLYRNAADPTDFLRIPPNRVVELGSQTTI